MKSISVQNQHEVFERRFVQLWFGFLLAALIFLLIVGGESVVGFVGIAVLAGFGVFIFWMTMWSVVDGAFDCGDSLVFQIDSTTYEVPFAEISAICHPFANFKGLITIKTRRPIQSRRRFTFRGAPVVSAFTAPPIFDELQRRVETTING